jgi:TonB family C-terminal domain
MLRLKENTAGKSFVLSILLHIVLFLLLSFSGLWGSFAKPAKKPPVDINIYQEVGAKNSSQGKMPQIDLPQNGAASASGSVANKSAAADFSEATTSLSDGTAANSGLESQSGKKSGTMGSQGDGSSLGESGGGAGNLQGGGQAALPARLLTHVSAIYPENLRRQKIKGRVTVGATIGADGNIEESHIVTSSGVDEFDQAALTAFDQSTFSPAKNKQGQGIRWYFKKNYNFSLED